MADNVENLTLIGSASVTATGNALANLISGNDGADRLFGMDGNDTIVGGAGNDLLNGGNGDDTLTGGLGADTFQFGVQSGHDTVVDFGQHGDHDIIDISAWLIRGHRPTITDAASGLTMTFDAGDSIHLLGVHPNQLIATSVGYTI